MSHQFPRLSAVCKVLFDTELIALRKKNDALRLNLFWKKYSAKKLRSAIKRGNKIMPGIPRNCNCETCIEADRYWGIDEYNPNEICAWRPLFEAKLVELGIGFSNEPDYPSCFQHECAGGHGDAADCDTHIVNILSRGTSHDWSEFTYGSKLFNATTVTDPELHKLVALFEWLVPSDC
jgi:hypothetical protein